MNTHGITHNPQRGWLTYQSGWLNQTPRESGWFALSTNGDMVCRRATGGRNVYLFCHISRIISFEPDTSAKG